MGMRQVYWGRKPIANTISNVIEYTSPVTVGFRWNNNLSLATNFQQGRHRWLVTSTFRNWRITFAAPSNVAWTFNFRISNTPDVSGDTATALTVTIPAGQLTGSNVVNTAVVAAGQYIAVCATPSPPFASQPSSIHPSVWWSIEADHAASSGISAYGTNAVAGTGAAVSYNGLYIMQDDVVDTSSARSQNVMPLAGNWVQYCVDTHAAPASLGPSGMVRFHLMLNDVAQDGSVGTVDTTITLTTLTAGSWTGVLPVVPGQRVAIRATITGFSAGQGIRMAFASVFDSATPNAWPVGGANGGTGSNTLTQYIPTAASDLNSSNWGSTEIDRELLGSFSDVTLSGLWVWLLTAPGSGNSWTYQPRLNEGDPAGVQTLTLANTTKEGNTPTGSFTIGLNDRMAFREVPFSNPGGSAGMAWTFFGTVPSPPPPVDTACPVTMDPGAGGSGSGCPVTL